MERGESGDRKTVSEPSNRDQPSTGDVGGEGFAVRKGKQAISLTVNHKGRSCDVGEAVDPRPSCGNRKALG